MAALCYGTPTEASVPTVLSLLLFSSFPTGCDVLTYFHKEKDFEGIYKYTVTHTNIIVFDSI